MNQSKLIEGRHPTRDELDAVAPNNPVQLTRCCLHMGVYNTKALELTGITGPEMFAPGEVVVDSNGRMTGLLKERACTYMWKKVIYTEEEYMQAFKCADELFLSYGITNIHDVGFYGEETIGLFQKAYEEDIIKTRMYHLLYNTYGKNETIQWIDKFISTGIRGVCKSGTCRDGYRRQSSDRRGDSDNVAGVHDRFRIWWTWYSGAYRSGCLSANGSKSGGASPHGLDIGFGA